MILHLPQPILVSRHGNEHYGLLNLERPNGVLVVNNDFYEDYFNHFSTKNSPTAELRALLSDYNLDVFDSRTAKPCQESESGIRTLSCWIHLTNACNLACEYCYVRKTNHRMEEATAKSVIAAIKRTIKANGIQLVSLALAGGEPTLNLPVLRLFCEEMSQLHEVRVKFSITTNATQVSDEFLHLLREYNMRLYVSLDGVGKYNNARVFASGKPSFEAASQGLEKLANSIGADRLAVGIVVSPVNVDGLEEITRFLLARNMQLKYSFYRPSYVLKHSPGTPAPTSTSDFAGFCEKLQKHVKACLAIIREKAPPGFNPEAVVDKFTVRGNGRRAACSMGDQYCAIGWDGQISRCHVIQDMPVGAVTENTDIFQMLRERGNPHAETGTLCAECAIRSVCRAGCRLLLDTQGKASIYHEVFLNLFDEYIDTIVSLTIKRGSPLEFEADETF